MTTAVNAKPIAAPVQPAPVPLTWLDEDYVDPRPSLRDRLTNFILDLGILVHPFIDAFTDREAERHAAILNDISAMDNIYFQVWSAYFFVHQPQHYRGERYHPGAVAMFRKMTRCQAQAYLQIFRSQHDNAEYDLIMEYGKFYEGICPVCDAQTGNLLRHLNAFHLDYEL